MMTRRQLRELAAAAGLVLALLSFCFSTEHLVAWFAGAPLCAAGALAFAVSPERRHARRSR